MAEPKTLEEALEVIKTLTATVARLPELETAVETHLVTISSLKDELSKHPAVIQALQSKLAEADTKLKASEALPAQIKTLTETNLALTNKLTSGFTTRLTMGHGLKEDLIKGKSIIELEAMETALLAVRPNGQNNPPANSRGMGFNGGGSQEQNGKSSIEADLEVIETARNRKK